jgi:hypothetical protein
VEDGCLAVDIGTTVRNGREVRVLGKGAEGLGETSQHIRRDWNQYSSCHEACQLC